MGDTQPFVSLATRFKQQGHTVKLAARPDFASLAASYDLEFAPLGNPYKSLLRSEEIATAIGSGNMLKMLIKQASDSKKRKAFFDGLDTDAMRAVEGAEATLQKQLDSVLQYRGETPGPLGSRDVHATYKDVFLPQLSHRWRKGSRQDYQFADLANHGTIHLAGIAEF